MNLTSVADLVSQIRPFQGQDLQLVYHVYTDLNRNADADIAAWTMVWTLFTATTDVAAILTRTPSLASPLATVTVTASQLATLTPTRDYFMQLWRIDSGNTYPLTGVSKLTPQYKPPLT